MYVALRATSDDASALDGRLCVATAAFYAGVLVAPWHAGVAAIGFLIAVFGRRWRLPNAPSPAATAFVGVTVLVAITAVLPVLLHPVNDHGLKLLAQFLLLPAIAVLTWMVPRTPGLTASLWAGVTVGAVLSGVAALVQIAVMDMDRAVGTEGNAIVFGDLALLMGGLSIALAGPATTWWSTRRPDGSRMVDMATLAAAIGGGTASILSGSRGGWLALFPMALVLAMGRRRSLRRGDAGSASPGVSRRVPAARAGAVALLAATVMAVAGGIAGGMPLERLAAGLDDVTGYVAESHPRPKVAPPVDPAGTTIGARFEAWRSAADAVADHPVLGLGWGNLQTHFERQVATEGRHQRIAEFTHAHQQMLGAWASSGVVGAAAFAALAAVPARHFRRAARSPDDTERAIGTAGLLVVVAFVVFGLTESILENLVPVVFYAVTVGVLSSQLRIESLTPTPVKELRNSD